MPQMIVASWGRKSWFTKFEVHSLKLGLIRELTLVPGATVGRGEMTDLLTVDEDPLQQERLLFVIRVNNLMSLWHGSKVNVFRVHFSLGKEFTPQLDQWITDAVNMGALHSSLLTKEKFSTIRHLTLKCCNLTPSCSFDGLVSLKSLALDIVTLTGSFLKDVLSHGLELEQLSLKRLTMDRDCKFNIDLSKLKYLAIVDCERLRGININGAVELNEFFFAGKHEYFSFKNVPKLVNVSFNCNTDDDYGGVLDVLSKFGHRLPQLEILNLHGRCTPYIIRSDVIPQSFKVFPNLKYLELVANSFDNDILWIAYLLKFLPLLEELHLLNTQADVARQIRKPTKSNHKNLRILHLEGFCGNIIELELTLHVLKRCKALEKIVIDPSSKFLFGGDTREQREDRKPWEICKPMEIQRWLSTEIPKGVQEFDCVKHLSYIPLRFIAEKMFKKVSWSVPEVPVQAEDCLSLEWGVSSSPVCAQLAPDPIKSGGERLDPPPIGSKEDRLERSDSGWVAVGSVKISNERGRPEHSLDLAETLLDLVDLR
ncbi:uncharacterized protein LOC142624416 [Castanea sativa]|uniref:uncharacterized protein LOC142624416 n=1 Tax=Castanea sativa TaxID=21020 RepID=UPI003F650B54